MPLNRHWENVAGDRCDQAAGRNSGQRNGDFAVPLE
jgi:hypothetical protein